MVFNKSLHKEEKERKGVIFSRSSHINWPKKSRHGTITGKRYTAVSKSNDDHGIKKHKLNIL